MGALTPEARFRLLSALGLVLLVALVAFLMTGAWLAAAGAFVAYILLSLPLFPLARAIQGQSEVAAPQIGSRRTP